ADGGKFGKTESGNVWLDPRYTSPYKFYQFWLNVSDADAEKYIKIFTELTKEEIDELVAQQTADPGMRPLQKRLAKEITTMVHSAEDYEAAVEASKILFSNNTADILHKIDEATLLSVFEGVQQFEISRADLESGEMKIADLLTEKAPVFPSKAELRKLAQGGGFSINKEKVADVYAPATTDLLLQDKYILVQKGKKNYFLLHAV
ncbi:MAG: tyrosine--tRNA ligase, partial [Muribaculaceae bacterium]|nr:tyrosine--tRNA ligase [Muribaculaceae bacterium]